MGHDDIRHDSIVRVVFPDPNRLQYLGDQAYGDQAWRARLRPVSCFTISATQVCDLRYEKVIRTLLTQRVASDTQKIVSVARILSFGCGLLPYHENIIRT